MKPVSRPTRLLIVFVVLGLLTVMLGFTLGRASQPYGGEFENVPLTQIKGKLVTVKSFEVGDSFKFLWQVEVAEATPVQNKAPRLLADPVAGDIINLDVKDSRANNFIDSSPQSCFRAEGSVVRVCVYTITQSSVIVLLSEHLGSNNLPEFEGSPR